MKGLRLSGIFRYLAGILLVQVATALLVVTAIRLDTREAWLLLGLFALTLGLVTAFWFGTIASHAHQEATARLREQFSRERERIKVRAEREKTKVIQKSQQQLEKERRKTQAKANTRVTLMFTGLVAAGGLMVFTQFMTFGCQWPINLTPFRPIKLTHLGRQKIISRVCTSVDSSLLPA